MLAQKTVDWLVPEVFSFLLEVGKDKFIGIRGKYKLWKLKRELKKEICQGILEKYGQEEFYHDLDVFLESNKVILKIITNCTNVSVADYKSNSAMVTFYIKQFEELHPEYIGYYGQISGVIKRIFDVIQNVLNQVDDEAVRVVCNTMKELSGELEVEVREISKTVKEMDRKLSAFLACQSQDVVEFNYKGYLEYVVRAYPNYQEQDYIERKIYPKCDENQKETALSVLTDEKRVLLLGEAGFGKTYEAITLLRQACCEGDDLLPLYLPLSDYGRLYSSIRDGIKCKVLPFCEGNPEELIEQWLRSGRIVLIFDGVDDVTDEKERTKLILEIKNISQQYNACFYFVTSRINRYHGELNEFNSYHLTGLDKTIIRGELIKKGIHIEIPESYYQLFQNPLFFEVGKMVLSSSSHRELFNRSNLFEQLILLLYSEWEQRKGIFSSKQLGCIEIVCALGEMAYKSFEKTAYGFLEFEKEIVSLLPNHNSVVVISSIIASGLIRVTDRISFTHKLFKEYCIAYYLFSRIPLPQNKELYLSLVCKDEWKEVFIFIAGLCNTVEMQDEYLDFIMHNNLPLYVECINAKSDLYYGDVCVDNIVLASRYMKQIYSTYTYIVSSYFAPIASKFTPRQRKTDMQNQKICIMGNLSEDGKYLHYWFDIQPHNVSDIVLISEMELPAYYKERERKALIEQGSFKSFGINLALSGLEGDTGRKIALDLVKGELKDILDKHMLIESDYLLCERVNRCKNQIKELRGTNDLQQMQCWVAKQVNFHKKQSVNVVSITHNNVELIDFLEVINDLVDREVDFGNAILPGEDVEQSAESSFWVWDLYSERQKINRIEKYFYYQQLSYIQMVESNFPKLGKWFSKYLDTPYQNIVIVDFDKEGGGRDSAPTMQYFHVASPEEYPVKPDVQKGKGDRDYMRVYEYMMRSYRQQGKMLRETTVTSTRFFLILDEDALSKGVYEEIKKGLEEIWGRM